MKNTFDSLFLEFSEPIVIIEAERANDWKATSGSLVKGKLVTSKDMNDSRMASTIEPPAALIPVNGKDTLIAVGQSECFEAGWISEEVGGTLAFIYSLEEPGEKEIRKALKQVKAKDWTKLEVGIETLSPNMILLSSLSQTTDPASENMAFQLAPGPYQLHYASKENDEIGLEYEFIQFVPGDVSKKKAVTSKKKSMTLSDLLKSGKDSDFKSNRVLLDSKDEWTTEMASDACLAIERLSSANRKLIFLALDKRKQLIPDHALERLENFVLASQDPGLINDYLYSPRLHNPDHFIVQVTDQGLLETCRYGIEKYIINDGFYSHNAYSKLFSLAKTGREIVVISQIFEKQLKSGNQKGAVSDERYLLHAALGDGAIPRIEVRDQLFYMLETLKGYYHLRPGEEDIINDFGSIDEFMKLLQKTIETPKLAEGRSFTSWLATISLNQDKKFRAQTESSYPKVWEAIDRAPLTVESWKKK